MELATPNTIFCVVENVKPVKTKQSTSHEMENGQWGPHTKARYHECMLTHLVWRGPPDNPKESQSLSLSLKYA